MENEDNAEIDLIEELNLSEEQIKGVEKYMEALSVKAQDIFEIEKALNTKFALPLEKKNLKVSQKKVLYNLLQEYFSCFFVVGFDHEGNELSYHHAPNALMYKGLNKFHDEFYRTQKLQESGILKMLQQTNEELYYEEDGEDGEYYEDE